MRFIEGSTKNGKKVGFSTYLLEMVGWRTMSPHCHSVLRASAVFFIAHKGTKNDLFVSLEADNVSSAAKSSCVC